MGILVRIKYNEVLVPYFDVKCREKMAHILSYIEWIVDKLMNFDEGWYIWYSLTALAIFILFV